MASAEFQIDDDGGGFGDVPNGIDVAAGSVITCRIKSMAGVRSSEIVWEIIGTHDSTVAKPALTLGGSPVGQTAQFTVPAGSGAYGVRCTVNGGPDVEGNLAATEYTAGVYVLFGNGERPFFVGETFEADATHGAVERFNTMLEGLGAGGGGYTTIQEEGAGLTGRATANFIGSYVTAADNAGASRTDITFRSILNADVDASAAIAFSKLASDADWNAVLSNAAITGGVSPLLSSGDAYDTDTGVDLTFKRAGSVVAVADGSQWDFQNDNLITTGFVALGDAVRATLGEVRLPQPANSNGIRWRNVDNDGNILALSVDPSENVVVGHDTLATAEVRLNSVSGLRVRAGSADQLVVTTTSVDVNTNYIQQDGISKPATPPSTEIRTYCDASGTSALAYVDDAGMAHIL